MRLFREALHAACSLCQGLLTLQREQFPRSCYLYFKRLGIPGIIDVANGCDGGFKVDHSLDVTIVGTFISNIGIVGFQIPGIIQAVIARENGGDPG